MRNKNSNAEPLRLCHHYLVNQGFEPQFAGSMIQYRLKKNPTISLAILVKEHPYRKAGQHGLLEYSVRNTTFLAGSELEEQAQEFLNGLVAEPLLPRASVRVQDFEGMLDKKALALFKKACQDNQNLREGFKIFLKALYDWFLSDKPAKKNP